MNTILYGNKWFLDGLILSDSTEQTENIVPENYNRYLIDKLEELVLVNTANASVLKEIDQVLASRRVRLRNSNLRSDIARMLNSINSTESLITIPQESRVNQSLAEVPQSEMNSNLSTEQNTAHQKPSKTIYPEGFLVEAFEDMRNKLLDISGGRSRLLNLDQGRRGVVRIVDELPDELAKTLISEKAMTVIPVPEPTKELLIKYGYIEWDEEEDVFKSIKKDPDAKEWANLIGLKNDYDLPNGTDHAEDDRHTDLDLQSLMFEPALNLSLKKLASEARTSIDETGNNILFLSLGFLEWYDQAVDGRKRLAPLFMLPVKIVKKTVKNVAVYHLSYTGEDIIPNLTLREKLSLDFGMTLPNVLDSNDEERLRLPEEYFNEVNALLARKCNDPIINRWKIRRFGTLATLSLGKLLMYLDLDPSRWPEGDNNLLEHDVVKSFFQDGSNQSSADKSETSYVLDDIPELHKNYPMIEDADSSQMSVLIDVLKGGNMVVEGPPGTGKSQTITNLIAAAIAQNKTVLFVAEKQAALDVVKRRMDKAGLGTFCLDLHSNKAQKRLVLDSIQERKAGQNGFRHSVADYDVQVSRYERAREQLQEYVNMVNQPWKNTGFSIHEILCAATRFAKEVSPISYSDIAPDAITGDSFNRVQLDEQLEQVEVFYNFLGIISKQLGDNRDWSSHPWFGVKNKKLVSADHNQVVNSIIEWNDAIRLLSSSMTKNCKELGINEENYSTLTALELLVESWANIPTLQGNEVVSAFREINPENFSLVNSAINTHKEITQTYKRARLCFTPELIEDLDKINLLSSVLEKFQILGVPITTTFDELAKSLRILKKLKSNLNGILRQRTELLPHLIETLQSLFPTNQAGLSELSDFVQNASNLDVKYIKNREDIFDNEELMELLFEIKPRLVKIYKERERLSAIFKIGGLTNSEILSEYSIVLSDSNMFSWFSSSWRNASKNTKAICVGRKYDNKTIVLELKSAVEWINECNEFSNSVRYKKLLGSYFKGLKTDWPQISAMVKWYGRIRKEYGVGFGRRVPIANALFSMPADIFKGILNLNTNGFVERIIEFKEGLGKLSNQFPHENALTDFEIELEESEGAELLNFEHRLESQLQASQFYLLKPNVSISQLTDDMTGLKTLAEKLRSFYEANINKKIFDNKLDFSISTKGYINNDLIRAEATLKYVDSAYSSIKNTDLRNVILHCYSNQEIINLIESGVVFLKNKSNALENENLLMNMIESSREKWCPVEQVISDIIQRNTRAINSVEWLDSWLKYLFAKARMEVGGFGRLKKYLTDNEHSLEKVKKILKFSSYQCLAQEIYREQDGLAEKSGHEQTALQQQFAKYDEKLKQLQRKRVASLASSRTIPRGTSGARIASYTENVLIEHEINKKSRHISIRNLVIRAGKTMQAYKPCFMMSPMAVAKYIPPDSLKFDLVIMDEASQVKPEYALSCFARGSQVVVVGDPKQLPPTSFFERSVSNDESVWDSNDSSVIDEAESILDAVGGQFPMRQLRWHYRSRHESLIEFSNHKFYDSKLVVFPSPWNASEEYGVKFNHIEDGRFLKSINIPESRAVVQAIRFQIINRPNESLGVVAMNAKQREQIEGDLEIVLSQDKIFRIAFEKNLETDDPLFIKNLENVQGDERDVIFISFTYGPQEKGSSHIPQRFGPINGPSGWRRLNVLFTRSKKRIQIYSSMMASQIVLSDSSSLGLKSLKGYLEFAQTGRLTGQTAVQEGEPDSDFEIAVMDALAQHGFECVPQVGVAGFFIDIAVRDPGMPGRYLMGIECDGATYHNSKSTRDRDRVRQSVLEGLDWNIYRIWSTDWFKHPDAELKPIIDRLKQLATPITEESHDVLQEEFVEAEEQLDVEGYLEESHKTLGERLLNFAVNVIERKHPDTEKSKQLLRPEMLARLVEQMPNNREEFAILIPAYLRMQTCPNEAKEYLDDVLEIISDSEVE